MVRVYLPQDEAERGMSTPCRTLQMGGHVVHLLGATVIVVGAVIEADHLVAFGMPLEVIPLSVIFRNSTKHAGVRDWIPADPHDRVHLSLGRR